MPCPSTSSNDLNSNGDSYLLETTSNFNKLSADDTDHDNHSQLLPENLQSSSKEGKTKLIK